ncbi:hypothetical protein AVEN_224865-1, partial [Araneus ventricosus]
MQKLSSVKDSRGKMEDTEERRRMSPRKEGETQERRRNVRGKKEAVCRKLVENLEERRRILGKEGGYFSTIR